MEEIRVVTVTESNVEQEGFFCYKSKPNTKGYQGKLAWLRERFKEGMRIQILYEGKRSIAFIEYIPGEYAWRAVNASGYMFIHCIWVVGSGKNKGYATRLIELCEQDALQSGMQGVAMVTSSGVWLVDKKILLKNGYQVVDHAPPSFDLLVKKFKDAPDPSFPQDWQERASRHGQGLTVLRSNQCPYIPDAVLAAEEYARENGLAFKVVEFQNARQVREGSPSPYGLYSMVYNGQLLAYHYLLKKDFDKFIARLP